MVKADIEAKRMVALTSEAKHDPNEENGMLNEARVEVSESKGAAVEGEDDEEAQLERRLAQLRLTKRNAALL